MSAQVINIAEVRIRRAQARHAIGQTAAAIHATGDLLEREARNRARLTRVHLMHEAIDEAITTGGAWDYETIMATVQDWEQTLESVDDKPKAG